MKASPRPRDVVARLDTSRSISQSAAILDRRCGMRRVLGSIAAVVFAACGATTAYAQQATDYVVQQYTAGSKYESPPTSATTTSIAGDDISGAVALPFTFTYFG